LIHLERVGKSSIGVDDRFDPMNWTSYNVPHGSTMTLSPGEIIFWAWKIGQPVLHPMLVEPCDQVLVSVF
jgi:hypothetical protein